MLRPTRIGERAKVACSAFGAVLLVSGVAPPSMAGMNSGLGFSPYAASKIAVVNMSEGLTKMAAPLGIDVTVLCVPDCANANLGERAQSTED
jgi:short-subunit dehydrogenase